MKRSVIAFVLVLVACASVGLQKGKPKPIVLYAQTLPASAHAQFTPSTATGVVDYAINLDGVQVATFVATGCSPTQCSAPFQIANYGSHSVTVAARNYLISSDPSTAQSGPPTPPVSFTLNQSPSTAPANATVTK